MASPREEWPISECLGVFLGVLGVDWLIDGKAQFLPAVAAATAVGLMILVWRIWRRRRRDE